MYLDVLHSVPHFSALTLKPNNKLSKGIQGMRKERKGETRCKERNVKMERKGSRTQVYQLNIRGEKEEGKKEVFDKVKGK